MFALIVHMIHLHRNKIGAMERGPYNQQSQISLQFCLLLSRGFLLVIVCRFSANTQIISTDSGDDSVQKENFVKNSQSFQAFGFKRSWLSLVLLNPWTWHSNIQTFTKDCNRSRTAQFWICSNFHLMEKLFSAPLIGTFHLEPPLISETFWESSSLHRLWRISSQSLCLEHFIGIVRRKCVCMTGIKPRYMCFHEAICRHTFSKGTSVHLCKVCDRVLLITGNMLFHFSLIGKLNLYMYSVGYYLRKPYNNHD